MKVAVIPARGGSKRIPRKNIKPFSGKPMIGYAIEVARQCGLFKHVVVSTDDSEISQIAISFGAEIFFHRPPELSDDNTPTVPVIRHAIAEFQSMGWEIDLLCCIYPCVPFLQCTDLNQALQLLGDRKSMFSFPVVEFPSAIQRGLRRKQSDGSLSPFYPEYTGARTQDLDLAFYDAGQFYWGSPDAWNSICQIHAHGLGLVVPGWRVVDIDTPDDWRRAELLSSILRAS